MARFRGQALTVALLLATAGIWWTVNRHFPLPHWLLWGVLASWLASALWLASCAAVGWLVVQRLARDLGWLERLVIAIPLGVLTFAWCTFLLGLAGGLGRAAFFLLPALFLLTLATSTARRDLKRAYRHRRALFEHAPVLRSRLALAAIAFGTIGLLLTYVPILTPENIQHDARWYHLPIAQQYSSSGRIEPFAEGWILGTYPHLASLLYCWALTAPVGILGRLLLCAHLEYLLFLYTLAAIPVTIRALLGQRAFAGASWSWAAFFLYPGILVYDSNLSTGADHVAAIWAPAGLLLVLRLWTTPDLRAKALSFKAALLGALAGGAALTKYSAICAAAPLLLGLIWACIRPRWRELSTAASATKSASTFSWVPIGVGLAAFVLVTSQHWLKNWVWHGDPLYPILRKYLPAHPWHADAEAYFRAFKKGALLKPNRGALGVWQALRANVTLGFEVNDYDFHGQYPTFGYLFPITALLSFLVPSRWRVRGLAVLCMCGVTIWFATNHRDRYLQAILPWMVAVTFCALRVAWRQHGASVRAGLVLLVGSQLTTSLDVWLFPSHMAEGAHPILPLYDFVKLGMEGKYAERAQVPSAWGFADWVALGSKLPRGSKVLVHEDRLWTGLDAPVVTDEAAWQAGLHYGSLRDTRAVHQALREYGVTHIVTGHPHGDGGFHALAGELLFWDYVRNQTCPVARSGHLELHRLPSSAPERGAPERVLVMTCQASEPAGVYDLRALRSATAPPAAPFRPIDVEAVPEPIWEGVEYVVTEDECGNWETGTRAFTRLYTREKLTFWRRAATAPRPVGCKSK